MSGYLNWAWGTLTGSRAGLKSGNVLFVKHGLPAKGGKDRQGRTMLTAYLTSLVPMFTTDGYEVPGFADPARCFAFNCILRRCEALHAHKARKQVGYAVALKTDFMI